MQRKPSLRPVSHGGVRWNLGNASLSLQPAWLLAWAVHRKARQRQRHCSGEIPSASRVARPIVGVSTRRVKVAGKVAGKGGSRCNGGVGRGAVHKNIICHLDSLRHNITTEFHFDTPGGLATDGHVLQGHTRTRFLRRTVAVMRSARLLHVGASVHVGASAVGASRKHTMCARASGGGVSASRVCSSVRAGSSVAHKVDHWRERVRHGFCVGRGSASAQLFSY